MGKVGEYLVGLKTILGAIIQIAGAVGMVAAALSDYLGGIEGAGLVKGAVGLGFAGNAIGQLGIRFAKKSLVLNTEALQSGPDAGLIPPSKVVGEIVNASEVAGKK